MQRREIGRYIDGLDFESLLWIGMTDPVFHSIWNKSCEKQSSNNTLSGLASSAQHSFKNSGRDFISASGFVRLQVPQKLFNFFGSELEDYPLFGIWYCLLNCTSFWNRFLCAVKLAFTSTGPTKLFILLVCWDEDLMLVFQHWHISVCSGRRSRQCVNGSIISYFWGYHIKVPSSACFYTAIWISRLFDSWGGIPW